MLLELLLLKLLMLEPLLLELLVMENLLLEQLLLLLLSKTKIKLFELEDDGSPSQRQSNSEPELQSLILCLQEWCEKWQLNINVAKSNV